MQDENMFQKQLFPIRRFCRMKRKVAASFWVNNTNEGHYKRKSKKKITTHFH